MNANKTAQVFEPSTCNYLDSRETGPLGDICHFKKERTRLRILRELSSLIICCFLIQSSYSLEFITISQSLTLPLDKVIPLFGRQFDSLQTSCLRIILGVSRTDHVSNEEVYDRTGTALFSQSDKARQIRFLGHCLRRPQGDLISTYALYHPTNGKPRPGGRKILFYEYAAKLINPEIPPASQNSCFVKGPNREA